MVSPANSADTPSIVPTFVAAVTAYCDQEALVRLLCAIAAQNPVKVSRILVVDNSPSALALPQLDGITVEQIHTPHNPGLVSGVNYAMDWAAQQKADFLWLFDQDSLPSPGCLQQLWFGWQRLEQAGLQPGVVGPTIEETQTQRIHHGYEFLGFRYRMIENPQIQPQGYYLCDMILHSGSLIRATPPAIPSPLPEWIFLDALEHALAEQLSDQGKAIAVISQARMAHRYGNPVQVKSGNQTLLIQNYSTLRYYTICRNQTWFEIRHANSFWNRIRAIIYAIKRCRKMRRNIRLLHTQDARLKKSLCWKGTWAGIVGKQTIPDEAMPPQID